MAPPPPLHGLGSLVILVVDLPRVDQDSRGVEPATTQSQSQWRSYSKKQYCYQELVAHQLNGGPNYEFLAKYL